MSEPTAAITALGLAARGAQQVCEELAEAVAQTGHGANPRRALGLADALEALLATITERAQQLEDAAA